MEAVSISSSQFDSIDWSTHSLDVGILRGDGKEKWLPLDRTDLELLIQLLTRPVIPGVLPAAEASPRLAELVEWARAAQKYSERMNLP